MRNISKLLFLSLLISLVACSVGGLNDSNIEAAASALLRNYRFSGDIQVKGIQEIPNQNAAIADLRFNGFEYAVTDSGQLLETSKYRAPQPTSQSQLPSMEQMFPNRKTSYNVLGKALLKRYTDGRWILE